MTLTDPSLAADRKAAVVRQLVDGGASPATQQVLEYVAGNLRGRRPATAVEEFARLASDQRQRVLAEVRSAITLSPDQQVRLASALSRLQGREVRVNVVVDPEVVGGIVVRVGDDVIDGSVASRLEQARRAVFA
jgi:F-type H+-transporting ATPase subunit delta